MQDILSYIDANNLTGLCVGLCTFLVIGLFHPIVIKAEYHWGVRSWWVFLVVGLAAACDRGRHVCFDVVGSGGVFVVLEYSGDVPAARAGAQRVVSGESQKEEKVAHIIIIKKIQDHDRNFLWQLYR